TRSELENAELLRLSITSHFEPAGEECGTIYETLCGYCNLGRQVSDLILDLRRVPQHRDISETIAWVEWVVSSRFLHACTSKKITGAEYRPIVDARKPLGESKDWYQLRVSGAAGELAATTKLGRDPFTPSEVSWKCPLGHSTSGEFLSEIYLHRKS